VPILVHSWFKKTNAVNDYNYFLFTFRVFLSFAGDRATATRSCDTRAAWAGYPLFGRKPWSANMRCLMIGLFIGLSIRSTCLLADDWPQFRGPDRTDVSRESGLLDRWPEGGPSQTWLYRNAGAGYSGPAIVDGQLLTMGDREGTTLLLALDASTGEERWATAMGTAYENGWGNGPRGTPTVNDGIVCALSASGDLICVSAEDGSIRWKRNLVEDFGGRVPRWGYSESPLIDGNRVVCTPGGEAAAVIALDRKDGATIWKSECTEPAQYASVIPVDLDGRRQYIQLFMKRLVGLAADDGSTLWEVDFPGKVAVVPTPIVRGNRVFVCAGYGTGGMLVEFSSTGAEEVYSNKVMKNHHGGVILIGDYLFGHSDSRGWVCQDFRTGKQVWRERKELGKGAIAYADGHLYCLDEETGELKLIEASTEGWQEKGSVTLDPQSEIRKPQGRIWTHPVISNGRLYLRDQDLIYCYDIRATDVAAR
jgi:outer membrane protein assembly factor BamB